MNSNLDLSVPAAKPQPSRTPRLLGFLLLVVVALQVTLLVVGPRQHSAQPAGTSDLPAEPSRNLALKLEKQGLNEAAAQAWEAYLKTIPSDPEKAARIWYRIGCLRQDSGQFEPALAAFYRSEAHAIDKDQSDDLGRRVQECLEALGKFAALRYELAQRVGIKPDEKETGDVVLAEIGPRKITKAELDRRIEELVDQQLAQLAGRMPPEELKKQKESLIQRLGTPAERQRFLEQFIIEQVLYLKAREDKLPDDPAVRAALLEAERNVLAQETLRRALAARIQITPSDVETYYKANLDQFVTPARVRLRHILLPDKDQAEAALNSIHAGQDFAELAKTASQDQATAAKGGELPGWVQTNAKAIPGIGASPDLLKAAFAAKAGDVLDQPYQTDKGWHVVKVEASEPEKQRSFEEARDDAYSRLNSEKQQDVQKALFEELRTHFDVVIHRDQFAPEKPEAKPGK